MITAVTVYVSAFTAAPTAPYTAPTYVNLTPSTASESPLKSNECERPSYVTLSLAGNVIAPTAFAFIVSVAAATGYGYEITGFVNGESKNDTSVIEVTDVVYGYRTAVRAADSRYRCRISISS